MVMTIVMMMHADGSRKWIDWYDTEMIVVVVVVVVVVMVYFHVVVCFLT